MRRHDSKVTKTRTIRLRNEVYDYFKGRPLNKAVEGLYEYIKGGEIDMTEEGIELRTFKGMYNLRTFERVCRQLNVRPDLMIDKIVASMEQHLTPEEAQKGVPKVDDWDGGMVRKRPPRKEG